MQHCKRSHGFTGKMTYIAMKGGNHSPTPKGLPVANISTNILSPRLPALFDGFRKWLSRGTEAYIAKQSRRAEIEALEAKSDAELARMGLTRDRIVHYVFSDRIWF